MKPVTKAEATSSRGLTPLQEVSFINGDTKKVTQQTQSLRPTSGYKTAKSSQVLNRVGQASRSKEPVDKNKISGLNRSQSSRCGRQFQDTTSQGNLHNQSMQINTVAEPEIMETSQV